MSKEVRACWISGSYYHRKEILDKIRKSLVESESYYFSDNDSASLIEKNIIGGGLFGDNRLVLLDSIPRYNGTLQNSNKKWKHLLENIPDDCIVVFNDVDTSKNKAIYNHVKKIGKVFTTPDYLKKGEAVNYFRELFNHKNKSVEDKDLIMLIEFVGQKDKGYDVDQLAIVTEQICAYVGNRLKNITTENIVKCMSNNFNFIIWDINNAVEDKDFIKCQKLSFKAFSNSKNIKSTIEFIMHILLRKFRLLLFIKDKMHSGYTHEDIKKSVSNLHNFSKKVIGNNVELELQTTSEGKPISSYSANMVQAALSGFYGSTPAVERFERVELVKAVKILEDFLYKVRYTDDDVDCKIMLDIFFGFICNVEDLYYKLSQNFKENVDG